MEALISSLPAIDWVPPATAVVLFAVRVVEMIVRGHGVRGKVTAPFTLAAMIASGTLILVCGCLEYFLRRDHFIAPLYALGLLTGVSSFLLRGWAARALGRFWSMQIELRADQPLVTTGPYGWVRHPIYTAGLLEMLTIILLCQAAWTIIPTLLIFLPILVLRLKLEEAAMVRHFGPPYAAYMARVPSLLPMKIARR
jgi:protein-S-isoprenylcysteine O-methyltransferase Ste14